ncbi:9027_t:CDS:2, partial [Acaulospora colombiana]
PGYVRGIARSEDGSYRGVSGVVSHCVLCQPWAPAAPKRWSTISSHPGGTIKPLGPVWHVTVTNYLQLSPISFTSMTERLLTLREMIHLLT